MRDYIILAAILSTLPVSLIRPFFGGLVWTWIAFMNPHRLAWGFVKDLPVAIPVAIATLLGFALSNEPKRIPRSVGTYSLIAIWLCLTASTIFAFHPAEAFEAWEQRSKIMLMLLLIVALLNSRERLRALCLVTSLSVGYYGLRGGLFALWTHMQFMLYGPERSFLGDNTSFALALCMVMPMLLYLRQEFVSRSVRLLLLVSFFTSIVAVIGTYSRGGLLGLSTVVLALCIKNRRNMLASGLLAVVALGAVSFAPQNWSDRMSTIETYQSDMSANMRLNAWILAWRLAVARPILGWGSQAMNDMSLYDEYYPDSPTRHDVHNSYLEVLAENGLATFVPFLLMLLWCLVRLQSLSVRFRDSPNEKWISTYANMLQVSLLGYLVPAAFLEMAFFDLMFHVVGCTIALNELAREPVGALEPRRYLSAATALRPVPRYATQARTHL